MSNVNLYVLCGHGHGDSGATGYGYTEANLVRKLGQKIKALGGSRVAIADVNKNPYKDNLISKLKVSKNYKLLELHMDSGVKTAKGGHVIILKGFKPDTYDNKLAEFISNMFPGRASTIVERGDLANPSRAAAKGYNYRLLECGFISNADDVKKFNANIDEIAKGILECFGIPVVGESASKPSTSKPTTSKPSTSTSSTTYYKKFNSTSIVDGLKSIGVDSGFSNRTAIAKANGISNYKGTVSQNNKLLALARSGKLKKAGTVSVAYYKVFRSTSIVDGLKSIGVDSSFSNRRKIAKANGIKNYIGTASQNNQLLALAKIGKLERA